MAKHIVFLKSLALTPSQWSAQKEYFENKKYVVHALNYPNSNNMDEIAKFVENKIKKIRQKYKIQKVNLVGLSMGGVVGIKIANQHPNWIKKFIIADSFHDLTKMDKLVFKGLKKIILNEKRIPNNILIKIIPYLGLTWLHGGKKIRYNGKRITAKEASREELRKSIEQEGRQTIANHIDAMLEYEKSGKLIKNFKDLKNIQENIKIIAGKTEVPILLKWIEMKNILPKAQYELFNSGHLTQFEVQKEFNKSVENFIKSPIKRKSGKMKYIEINGIKTFYEKKGRGKEWLVLVHAMSLSSKMWKEQVKEFRKHFKVLVYDVRGQGKTDTSEGPFSIELFVSDLKELLNKLNIKKINLLGLSMGGMISQEFTINNPKMVNKLVLCDTYHRVSDDFDRFALDWMEEITKISTKLATFLTNQTQFPRDDEWELYNFFKKESAKVSKKDQLKLLKAVKSFDVSEDIKKIEVPTLIITGEDEINFHKYEKDMHNKIKGSELHVILGALHLTNMEKPEEFNKVVLEFLKK